MPFTAALLIDSLLTGTSGVIALALLLLVLISGPRQRSNQSFSLFAAAAVLFGLNPPFVNGILWLGANVPPGGSQLADPRLFAELASLGLYFIGPTFFYFATVYVEFKSRWHRELAGIGFLIGLALLPVLFSHQIISRVYVAETGRAQWEFTGGAIVLLTISLTFQILAFILLWRNRRQPGGSAMAISAAMLPVGQILDMLIQSSGLLAQVHISITSITFAASIMIMGYTLTSQQIFNPLRDLTRQLESKVAKRTAEMQQAQHKLERLNEKQRQVAQISREIARSATPVKVLARLVELIHGRLGYHHVYAYQPDETGQYLFLQAAAGTNAPRLLAEGQRLHVGRSSIVGQAAVERRPRLAQAQGENVAYFDNAALPGARAEMALPMLVGDRLLGVIDLQSIHLEAFSDEDLVVLTTLADQVAVTLDNLRLLQETGSALAELEKVQRQYLRQAWQATVGGSENAPAYVYTDSDGVTPTDLSAARSPEISQALSQGQVQANATDKDQTSPSPTVALPITLRGQVIGALQLRQKAGQTWQPEDLDTLSEVTERLGQALETARLSQETQRHADRERLIRKITDRMQRATDMETLLQTAAEELNKTLSASRVYVRLGTEADLGAEMASPSQEKHISREKQEPNAVQRGARYED